MSSKNLAFSFHKATRIRRVHWIVPTLCHFRSHLVGTGMRGYNLPTAVKLLEVHRCSPHRLLVGTRETDGPPS